MAIFRWIAEQIAAHGEQASWVASGISDFQQIKKGTLNFEGKALWTVARHRLCPTIKDDILSPV